MKKALILLLSIGLFAACNSNKDKGMNDKKNTTQGDDYRNNDGNNTGDNNNNNGNNNNGNNSFNTGGSWSSADIRSFNAQCLQELNNNQQIAGKFCPCFLEKCQAKYATYDEMNKNSTEAEGKIMATQCKEELGLDDNNNGNTNNTNTNNTGGGWTQAERSSFVNSCVQNAVASGLTSKLAQSYCSCMQQNLEAALPNSADAAKLTEADMNSPEMKRLAKSCLGQE
jgi:hypothetical protein